MLDKWGHPFSGYEAAAIERDGRYDQDDIPSLLGFLLEDFGFRDAVAVSCNTCGQIFTRTTRHMVRHRRQCGWDNGSSAMAF
jgi:hypothetical protein